MDYNLTAGGSFKLVWWHYIRSYPTKKVPKNLILEINSQGFENVKKKKKCFFFYIYPFNRIQIYASIF